MTATTVVGTITQLGYPLGVRHAVISYLGGYQDEFDVDAIEAELLALIDERLPEGVVRVGEELYATWGSDVDLSSYEDPEAKIISEEQWVGVIESHEFPQLHLSEQ